MNREDKSTRIKELEELFCSHCNWLERRQSGICPAGQTTCGAQINQVYQLRKAYSSLSAGTLVKIKDIFWAVGQDYATITIATMQENNRFGLAWTLLEKHS
ncbi:MAG: hypothetical protein HY819_15355 [Acidobacteria bacterium]|nr:hypothetical protein [Acidobacteriota bacterium]